MTPTQPSADLLLPAGATPGPLPGQDARMRSWKQQIQAALIGQVCGILVMILIVWLGHADALAVALWAPLSVAFSVFTYLALVRGWTRHVADPALTAPQIVFSITMSAASYAMAGAMRGQAFLWLVYGLLFSIFALPARQVRTIAVYILLLYAVTMAVMSAWQPLRYPWREELVYWFILLMTVPPMAMMATRMSELRAKLGRQKSELEQALVRIRELAARDDLTGLPNRRRGGEELARRRAAASRGEGLCVALIDLDHFKGINDAHGHAVGDDVLRVFAQEAQATLRGAETVARWGGEEFLALFSTADAEKASIGARRLLDQIARARVPLPGGDTVAFTVSIGLTGYRPGDSVADLLERADRALYRAKAEGRNRVVLV